MLKFQEMDGGRINKKFTSDCVIRSICIAMNKPYKEVFTDLMEKGLEMGAYPNCDEVWVSYLEENGWVKNKPPRDSRGKLIKLQNWENAPEVAVVRNSGHLTCVSDGYVVDTWDCRYRPVNSYWTKGV